jgi:hypothetical protein
VTINGFQIWNDGKAVKITMPKLQKPLEGYCACGQKMALSDGNKIPSHGKYPHQCAGVGAVVAPIKTKKPTRLGTGREEYEYSDRSDQI